eukprot:jgi/Mesen1/2177/ME000152S01266
MRQVQAFTELGSAPDSPPGSCSSSESGVLRGLVFDNLQNLYGEVVTTQRAVISNDPDNDPRDGGNLPEGHPRLNSFLGIPLISGGDLVGLFGIGNKAGGYDVAMQSELEPLTKSVAQIAANEGIISMDDRGVITSMNVAACKLFGYAPLWGPGATSVSGLPRASVNLCFSNIVAEIDGARDYMRKGFASLTGALRRATGVCATAATTADGFPPYPGGLTAATAAAARLIPLEISITRARDARQGVRQLSRPVGAAAPAAAGGAGGGREFYVAVIRGVEEQMRAQAALSASEERWVYALSGSEDGVWDWSVPTSAMFFSDRWKAMLGCVPCLPPACVRACVPADTWREGRGGEGGGDVGS